MKNKLVAETLNEYIVQTNNNQDELNEGFSNYSLQTFRKYFIKYEYGQLKTNQIDQAKQVLDWAKKIKGLKKDKEVKEKYGEDAYKNFVNLAKDMDRVSTSTSGFTPGNTAKTQTVYPKEMRTKKSKELAPYVMKKLNLSVEELKELLK